MIVTEKTTVPPKEEKKIPSYLIYETIDGVPVYYRGYKNVLTKKQTLEEIMAYGGLQIFLINLLKDYFQPIFGKTHWVWSGEAGVHVSHGSNPSLDFIILPKKFFSYKNTKSKYLDSPPTVVIEVDTKAEFEDLPFSEAEYYLTKTQALLDFGVQEVVWIFTKNEKIMVARPAQPWLTTNWKDEISIMNHKFSLQRIIDESEK